MNTTEILSKLIAFDSVSHKSNLPIIEWIEAYLLDQGVQSRRVYDATGLKANLFATIGPMGSAPSNPGYVLSGHTDVVSVEGQEWSSDPFILTDRDGKLFGRGACDMKGYLACMLAAVPDMKSASLSKPFHLAFSYDEEVGCVGVRTLLSALRDEGFTAEAVFVGEPTGMEVVTGHKGKKAMIARVNGFAAHSSLAPTGVNAVDYGAKLVLKVREIADRLARDGDRDTLYDVPFSTGHTGIMTGGAQLNIVPEDCLIEFEFRTLATDNADRLTDEVQTYARDELIPQMQAVRPKTGIAFEVKSDAPGLETPPNDPLVTLTKTLAGKNGHKKVAYGTEAGLFKNWLNIPAIVCGPGHIEQAHKPDEFIEVAQLEACDRFIARLIDHASL